MLAPRRLAIALVRNRPPRADIIATMSSVAPDTRDASQAGPVEQSIRSKVRNNSEPTLLPARNAHWCFQIFVYPHDLRHSSSTSCSLRSSKSQTIPGNIGIMLPCGLQAVVAERLVRRPLLRLPWAVRFAPSDSLSLCTDFSVHVVSDQFQGKVIWIIVVSFAVTDDLSLLRMTTPQYQNTMQRHRMIYAALSEELATGLHALSLKTKTPAEVQPATKS